MSPSKTFTFVGPLYPYRGGIAQFAETLFWGLRDRGHTTHGVTFSRQYPGLLFPGKTQIETDPVTRPVPAARLIDSLNPWSWIRTAGAIRAQRPQAVVFQFWMPFFGPAFGTIARRLKRGGIKIFCVVHNAVPHESRPGDKMFARYFLSQVDSCLVMSKAVEEDLRNLGITAPVKQIVHPVYDHFGDPQDTGQARLQLKLSPESKVLLFFGFIRKYKGLQVLLEAMPEITSACPDLHLVVAGEFYDEEAPYRDFVRSHGLDSAVHFHAHYIPSQEISTYFSAADAVVQPYLTATQSGVTQIAFHFNKPSIVTRVGGLPEIIPHEEAGLLVPPNDSKALAREIIRFYQDRLGPKLVEGVKEIKGRYSWDSVFEILEGWI